MTLTDFLVWLTAGGSIIAFSWLAERWAWFQLQTSNMKQGIMFGACVVLSLGAFAIQQYVPVETLNALAPWFGIVASIFVSLFLSKTFHQADKK